MKKIILVDLETTGLDPQVHEIIEIGAINVDTGAEFSIKVQPSHIETADPVAMKVNGYTDEKWVGAVPLCDALMLLKEFAGEGKYMMSYNVSFDRMFTEKAYKECEIGYPFYYHHFDLLTLAWYRLHAGSPLSLKSVCKQLRLEEEPDVHSALEGCRAAYRVYQKLVYI